MSKSDDIKIGKSKGRPMLTWVGKKPSARVVAYPAQHVERYSADARTSATAEVDRSDWPARFDGGGLLFHGDNTDVLTHRLANAFRGTSCASGTVWCIPVPDSCVRLPGMYGVHEPCIREAVRPDRQR